MSSERTLFSADSRTRSRVAVSALHTVTIEGDAPGALGAARLLDFVHGSARTAGERARMPFEGRETPSTLGRTGAVVLLTFG
jgi:hypothetical protein